MTFYPSNDIRINFGGTQFPAKPAACSSRLTSQLVGMSPTPCTTFPGSECADYYPVYNFKTVLRLVKKFLIAGEIRSRLTPNRQVCDRLLWRR